jgi:quercetin dioxygenase-like cupin family protein
MIKRKNLNLKEESRKVTAYFSPRIITEVNDQYVKIARINGQDVPWHNHSDEDELFYIIEGELLMEVENQPNTVMRTGDLFVVPNGVEHRVSSTEDCLIMLVESKSTKHTGDVHSPITKSTDEQKY